MTDRIVANSAFVETSYAGKILAATINYERYIGHSSYMTYYASIAFGYWKLGEGSASIEEGVTIPKNNDGYMIPVTVHSILFNGRSHLELGFGVNVVRENLLDAFSVHPIVNLGYRIQPLVGGMLIRLNCHLSHGFFPGVSIGYAF